MKLRIALLLTLFLASPARAAVVEGVPFAPSFASQGTRFDLAGAGLLRWKWVVKAYVAALYVGEGATSAQAFDDVPKRLEIEYFHAIDGPDFGKAALDRVRLNVSPEEFVRVRARIEEMNRLYVDVAPGDRYALTYLPGRGTELALNGRPLGRVPGADVADALFAIWIGKVPIDESLKQDLLGGG